jgi:hypothetical protein
MVVQQGIAKLADVRKSYGVAQSVSKVCSLANSQMIKLRAHAALLADALSGIGGAQCPSEVDNAVALLQMCSGIEKISFNTFQFDHTAGFCESADDFRDEHDKLRGALAHELTMFLFCWAALESFVDEIRLPPVKSIKGRKSGKIERLCSYLTLAYKEPTLQKWAEALNCWRCLAAQSGLSKFFVPGAKPPSFVGSVAEGVHLVYKVRNAFAHGDFAVPWPDRDDRPVEKHPDVAVVRVSTRIILMTIQALTMCYFDPATNVELLGLGIDSDESEIDLRTVFSSLHLESFPESLASEVES